MSERSALTPSRRILINGERLTEAVDRANGGGPKYHPQTMEQARELLQPQLTRLYKAIEDLPSELRAERVVFEATVWPNYIANSYFPDRLLAQTGVSAIGSKQTVATYRTRTKVQESAPTKSLVLTGTNDQVRAFERLLAGDYTTKSERTAAEELLQFSDFSIAAPTVSENSNAQSSTPEEDLPGTLRAFEAVLHPDPVTSRSASRLPASEQTLALLEAVVQRTGGVVKREHLGEVGGLTFVPVLLTPDGEELLKEFNPLRALRPMPRIRPLRTVGGDQVVAKMDAPREGTLPGAPEVYVFDGGIDASAAVYGGAVTSTDLVVEPANRADQDHGEAVTATVLYGLIDPASPLERPVAKVQHLRVTPTAIGQGDDLPMLLNSIRQALAGTHGALVNLSLGPDYAVDDFEPHQWTAVLDQLAYEQGAMFVTAPGNNGNRDSSSGLNRVQVPADMVNGISVGACDVPAPFHPWSRPSYSPVGPGRLGARVQPTLVAFGGTEHQPFRRLRADGSLLADDAGTSYAAPQLTHSLAGLRSELGGRGTASTLRAFAVHFAERRADDPQLDDLGFGRALSSFNEALLCAPNEVSLLYQGTVARDEVRAFYLPVPESLDRGNVTVHMTLAFTSPTDPTEAAEYTKAALEHTFRPHALRYRYTEPDHEKRPGKSARNRVRNEVTQRDDISDLLRRGWSRGLNPASVSLSALTQPEHLAREQGKWETIWDATRSFNASSLLRPRIDLSHISRAAGQLTRGGDDVDFSLLVSVTAPPKFLLYEHVMAQYDVLSALPTPSIDVSLEV